jgi:Abortive infection alpha
MTGIEAGAGKIAGAVVKSAADALAEDEKEVEILRRLAEEKGALDPAMRAYATRVALKQQIRTKLVKALAWLVGESHVYMENQFENDMADRLADVPAEEFVTPRLSVAGPAVQGLGFAVDEPELKAMYLNLLAAASDKRVQDSAHPSFAEVIKQLSASEAEALAVTLKSGQLPIIEIRLNSGPPPVDAEQQQPLAKLVLSLNQSPHGFSVLATNVLDWHTDGKQVAAPFRTLHIANWVRLGLVTVEFITHFAGNVTYDWVETTPLMVEAREQYDTAENKRVVFTKGILKVTEFGKVFERVVISSEALKPYPQRKHQTKSQIAINTAPGLKAGTLVARPDQSISLDRQTDRPFELAGAQHGPI